MLKDHTWIKKVVKWPRSSPDAKYSINEYDSDSLVEATQTQLCDQLLHFKSKYSNRTVSHNVIIKVLLYTDTVHRHLSLKCN